MRLHERGAIGPPLTYRGGPVQLCGNPLCLVMAQHIARPRPHHAAFVFAKAVSVRGIHTDSVVESNLAYDHVIAFAKPHALADSLKTHVHHGPFLESARP